MNQPTIYINKIDSSEAVVMAGNIRGPFGIDLLAIRELGNGGHSKIVRLTTFNRLYEAVPEREKTGEKLTPLEYAQKKVIVRQLLLNKWNKNRTKNDLGITINTLNAKIEKYGLVKPL